MKKLVLILFITFFSSISLAHIGHYNKFSKIEMEILRNNEVIGYNNYYFTKTPSINEIQKGINLYLEFIKKICIKFRLKEKDIKFKIHPMAGEYL